MPIGELSRLSGVNIETIRYYERIKMLPAPQRTASGRRVYAASELRMLAFIRRARELGFSLNEIRALLRLGAPGMASCSEVKVIATHHLEDIRAKLADLKKLERLLAKTVARCSGKKHQIAPFWTFSIFGGRPRDRCTAGCQSPQCPLWVKSRQRIIRQSCPLYPRKRTNKSMSVCPLCANSRHNAVQQNRAGLGSYSVCYLALGAGW
jgi:MerR family mercuric resistance operon transcriptional regulator